MSEKGFLFSGVRILLVSSISSFVLLVGMAIMLPEFIFILTNPFYTVLAFIIFLFLSLLVYWAVFSWRVNEKKNLDSEKAGKSSSFNEQSMKDPST